MVEIEISGVLARISDYQWSSEDKAIEQTLNDLLDPMGPSGADPDPDMTAALEALQLFTGKIKSSTPQEFDPKAVY